MFFQSSVEIGSGEKMLKHQPVFHSLLILSNLKMISTLFEPN